MLKSLALASALLCVPFTAHAESSNNFLSGIRSINVTMTRDETCTASQYGVGDGYNGKRTASGSRFNTYATSPYTAAHKTRPFGSMVTVTNLANGRSIQVRIVDRGPFIKGRCIDLGRAGATALGMGGLAKVQLN